MRKTPMRRGAAQFVQSVFSAVFLVACSGPAEPSSSAPAPAPAPLAQAATPGRHYFISAANPYAVAAGEDILKRGGSAVDAAIATAAVLGLVEPQSSGFGGGAFMLHYDPANQTLETYDGREVAPATATPDRFLQENGEPMPFYDAVVGGLSVGVPGEVRMLELAHEEHGSLAWPELLAPAKRLAEEGFEVSPRLNGFLHRFTRLKQISAAGRYFYDETGAPWPVGHVLKNPAYADTLGIMIENGPDAFYSGVIAGEIVEAVNDNERPGGMSLEDVARYRAVKREAVCSSYRVYELCSMGPPSSGGVALLQMLGLLEPFDLAGAGAGSAETLHLLFEASRLAYADRGRYLADQDQAAAEGGLTQEDLVAGLLNPPYIAARSALISREHAAETVEPGDPGAFTVETGAGKWSGLADDASPEPPSTSHFVIVDGEGRVVSMTASVEFAFGSHLMAGGMILNNQLTDFSFLPERDGKPVANAVAPGKRPRSSMSPVILFDGDGEIYGALGSPGGPAIIGYVAKTLIAILDWGMDMQAAIDYPHAVYPRGAPYVETGGFDAQVIDGLRRLGHDVNERDLNSGIHGFRKLPDGSYDGGADKRREGVWRAGVVED